MSSTKENIEEYGWEGVYVFDEKGGKQSFIYSIGFEETHGHPEIMIFGLKRETMHGILSDIEKDIREGVVFALNTRIAGVLGSGFEVLFQEVKDEFYSDYLGTAQGYYQKPFRAWVMFWPDKNNVLPMEKHCELDIQNEALQIV
jgi:hypothetical protein